MEAMTEFRRQSATDYEKVYWKDQARESGNESALDGMKEAEEARLEAKKQEQERIEAQ